MSKESVQFVEMAREAKSKEVTFTRWCEACKKYTAHTSHQEGDWEYLTCPCGAYSKYRTK